MASSRSRCLGGDLLGDGVGDVVGTPGEGADGALQGLLDHGRAGLGVGREVDQPAADVGDRLGAAAGRRRRPSPSMTVKSGESLSPRAGEHPGQVGGHGVDRVGRGAVEDDRDGGRPVGGLAQELPRHLVGVAGGRGDEDPEVGGREQLGGQRAVGLLDRVDVGRVEDGQPLGHGRGRDQLQGGRVVGRSVHALEVGQQAVLAEPRRVGGVVHEHRATGSSGAARRAR